jgi:hypothetical protein
MLHGKDLLNFILNDDTDRFPYLPGSQVCSFFAERLHNQAEKSAIRTALVVVHFLDDDKSHA